MQGYRRASQLKDSFMVLEKLIGRGQKCNLAEEHGKMNSKRNRYSFIYVIIGSLFYGFCHRII